MKPTSTLRGYQRHRLLVDPEQCAGFSGMAARMTTRTHFTFQFTRRYVDPSPEPRDVMRRFPAELMRMWPISTRINKPENDGNFFRARREIA